MEDFFQKVVEEMHENHALRFINIQIATLENTLDRNKFFKGPEEYLQKICNIMKWKTSMKFLRYDEEISYDEDVLRDYTYHFDRLINNGLREGKIGDRFYDITRELIKNIDRASTYENMILFRACSIEKDFEIGDIISDNAFMSKTCSLGVATCFLTGDHPKLFIMEYSTPVKQLFIAPYSKFPSELEFLTYPGEQFKIIASYTVEETVIYYTRYIGNDFREPVIIETSNPPEIEHLKDVLENDFIVVMTNEGIARFYHTGERQIVNNLPQYKIKYETKSLPAENPFEEREEVKQGPKRIKLDYDEYDFDEEEININTFICINDDTFEDFKRVVHGLFHDKRLKNIYTMKFKDSATFNLTFSFNGKEKRLKTNIFTVIKSKLEGVYISCDKPELLPDLVKVY